MKKRVFVLVLFTFLVNLLSGCVSGGGLLVGDQTTADEYMTNNPQLIEKYGADYTFVLTGGGGGGEINSAGKSGEMSFDYLVNQTDTYTVSVKQEKGDPWEVAGLLCISCQYECDEIPISIDLRTQNSLNRNSVSNGTLEASGIKKDTIATLSATELIISDASLWFNAVKNEEDTDTYYDAEWGTESIILVGDAESNFDEFTATVQPKYQDYLGSELTVLHFHAAE